MTVNVQDVRMAAHAASRIIKVNGLQFHPIERGLYDVFGGQGFATAGRYRHYKGRWFHVSGVRFDTALFPNVGNK